MTLKKINRLFLPVLLLLPLLQGCGVYSFSGAALSPDIQTFSVQTFANNSGEGPANLSQTVTENFKDYLQRNTNLKLAQQGGDLQYEGQILSYSVSPVAPQVQNGIDVAGANRLTIRVQVRYTNVKDPKQNFEQTFSAFKDFPQTQDVTRLDAAFINSIIEVIIFDVFNRSVANW